MIPNNTPHTLPSLPAIVLDLKPDQWRMTCDPEFCDDGAQESDALLYEPAMTIGGVMHHVCAYAVAERDGIQAAANPTYDEEVNALLDRLVCGRAATVEIEGREYVIVIHPAQD